MASRRGTPSARSPAGRRARAARRKSNAGPGAVGVALVLAQVHVQPADELAAEHHVQRRAARGSRACARGTATCPMRSSDCGGAGRGDDVRGAPRGAARRRRIGGASAAPASAASQPANARSAAATTARRAIASPTATSVMRDGARRRVERAGRRRARRPQPRLARCRVGMCPYGWRRYSEPDERALGDGRREVAELRAGGAAGARGRARSRASSRRGRATMSASSAGPRSRNRASVSSVSIVASGPTSVSSCAPSRARASCDIERRARAAPLVEHVGGQRPPGPARPRGSAGGPDRHRSSTNETTGTAAMLDRPDAQPVGERRAAPRPGSGRRGRRRAPGGASDRPRLTSTTTGSDPAGRGRAPARHDAERDARRPDASHRATASRPRRAGVAARYRVEVRVEVPGVAQEDVVRVQLIGLAAEAADRLQPVDEVRLGLRQRRARTPRSVGPSAASAGDVADDRRVELGQRAPGRRGRDDLEEAGQLARVLDGGDVGRDRAPRRRARGTAASVLPFAEDVGRQVELGVAGREDRRATARPDRAAAARRGPRGRSRVRRRATPAAAHRPAARAGRDLAEVRVRQRERLRRRRRRRPARATRSPGGSSARKNARTSSSVAASQVGGAADRQPVVRVVRAGRARRTHRHPAQPVGAVLVVLAPLVQHHVALVPELGLGERGQQIAHAIRLHPERQLQRAGRHHLPVVRPVGVGRPVERRAGAPAAAGSSRGRGAADPSNIRCSNRCAKPGAPGPLVLRARRGTRR